MTAVCLADHRGLFYHAFDSYVCQSPQDAQTPRSFFTPELSPPDSSAKPLLLTCLPLLRFPKPSGSHCPVSVECPPLSASPEGSLCPFALISAGFPLGTQLPLHPSRFFSSIPHATGSGVEVGAGVFLDPPCCLGTIVLPSCLKRFL